MIDGLLNTCTLFIAIWDPSILSFGYALLGVIMCLLNFQKSLLSGLIYRVLCIYAILVFGCKTMILMIYWFDSKLNVFDRSEIYELFGVHLASYTNSEFLINFYKEFAAVFLGIIGIKYRHRLRKNPQDLIRRSVMGLAVLFNMILVSLSYYSFINAVYFVMTIIWISFWGYRVNERFLLLSMTILTGFCLVHIVASGVFYLVAQDPTNNEIAIRVGMLILSKATGLAFFSTFCLYFTTISFVRRLFLRRIARNPGSPDMNAELLRNSTAGDEYPGFLNQILTYLSFTLVYGICAFNIFLWIVNFHGFLHLLLMIWLFYSIIEKNIERLMFITRKLLIPVLFFDNFLFYIVNLLDYQPFFLIGAYKKPYSSMYVLFEIWTISMFLLLQRRYKRKKYDISKSSITMNLIIGLLLENSNKISLIVVFIIGLSKINLFHVGFMVIFLVFMLNSSVSKKYWIVLVLYSQFVLAAEYTWGLVHTSGVENMGTVLIEIIGFESQPFELVAVIFPKDFLVWMLLLSAAMQLSAYRSTYLRNKREALQTGTESKVIVFFGKVYSWFKFLFVWVIYLVLFFTISLASLNILNGIRLLILISLFSLHVFRTSKPLKENRKKVDQNWYILIYYSGVLLVFRYLFQFNKFMSVNINLELIGIEVYSDQALYENVVTDCIILFVSVYHKGLSYGVGQSDFFSVTNLIKEKEQGNEGKPPIGMKRASKYFVFVYIAVVLIVAVFWRLSLSTGLYVLVILIYFGAVERHISSSILKNEMKKTEVLMGYRVELWKAMMSLTIIFIVFSYCCFFVSHSIVGTKYHQCVWAYFIMGFSLVGEDYLLQVNFEYMLIFILLTIERHFIDQLKFKIIEKNVPKNPRFSLICKIFIESFLPSLVLAIAFYKLTVVGVFYTLIVVFSIRANPLTRTKVLMYTLMVISMVQYLVLLANLSKYDSPYEPPENYEPMWKAIGMDSNSDVLSYLNLGNEIGQTDGLIGDFLGIWLVGVFFAIFAMSEIDIREVRSEKPEKYTKHQRNLKEIMYSSIHFLILFIVLLFVSESLGLFSLFYCVFCLICIFRATRILKNMPNFKKYLKLLQNVLIPFMCFELFIQMLYQAPFHSHLTENDEEWLNAVGFTRLWTAGGSDPSDVLNRWKRIYFKIFTLGFILLVFWLMNTADYEEFVNKLSKKYRIKAKKIGVELAQSFNDKRLKDLKEHEEKAAKSEKELEKLDENVQKWNEKFIESRKMEFGVNYKRGDQNLKDSTFSELQSKYKPGFKRGFQNLMIKLINPVLFKHFLNRLKLKKNQAVEEEEKSESVVIEDSSSIDEQKIENLKILQKLRRKQHIYILTFKDWMKILFYSMFSSTQGLVFLCFFLNHFFYASLESVVFPLSVLCYALLEYPRPSPNYFRIMLIYTEFIFLLKFLINLYIWEFISTGDYQDPGKIGFNVASKTYSIDLTTYISIDALCMLVILAHEYFLVRCGLNEHTEIELESLEQAKFRNNFKSSSADFRNSLLFKVELRPKLDFSDRIKAFFNKFGNSSEEKPGYDYYTRIVLIQVLLLLYILFFYSKLDGDLGSVENIFM